MLSLKGSVVLTASIAGVAFIGYSIYFDRKRRFAPNYKQKIREKRKQKQSRKISDSTKTEFPNLRDRAAVEGFIFSELTLGEELMNSGDLEGGAFHLSNAIIVSDRPSEFLAIFQQTLSPTNFAFLVQALPEAKTRLENSVVTQATCNDRIAFTSEEETPSTLQFVVDDDLE